MKGDDQYLEKETIHRNKFVSESSIRVNKEIYENRCRSPLNAIVH